jgi:hypothetical protein
VIVRAADLILLEVESCRSMVRVILRPPTFGIPRQSSTRPRSVQNPNLVKTRLGGFQCQHPQQFGHGRDQVQLGVRNDLAEPQAKTMCEADLPLVRSDELHCALPARPFIESV